MYAYFRVDTDSPSTFTVGKSRTPSSFEVIVLRYFKPVLFHELCQHVMSMSMA